MEATKRFLMDRDEMGYFKAILEGYEELAILTVIDGSCGLVELVYPACFGDEVTELIDSLRHEGMVFREVDHG